MASNKPSEPAKDRLNGVLNVDKPIGPSSMQAVARVRRKAAGQKSGHAGTLDPLASGVLLVALGRATKIIDRLMNTTKRYRTEIDLSAFTTTDDREGERTEVSPNKIPSRECVDDQVNSMVGNALQRPPVFSAVKIRGRRAYALARTGEIQEMPPRQVELLEAKVLAYAWPRVTIELHTGKGYYVRSFARDLGRSLGTGGHCATLQRVAVGPFRIEDSIALDDIPDSLQADHLYSVEDAISLLRGASSGIA